MVKYRMVYMKHENTENGNITRLCATMIHKPLTTAQENRSIRAMMKYNAKLSGVKIKTAKKALPHIDQNKQVRKETKKTAVIVEINGVKYTKIANGYKFIG